MGLVHAILLVLALPGALFGWWIGRKTGPFNAALLGGLVALIGYYLLGHSADNTPGEGFMVMRWFSSASPFAGVLGAVSGFYSARRRLRASTAE